VRPGTPPKILREDDDIHPLVGGSLAAIGLIVLAIAAMRFWKAPGLGWRVRIHSTLVLFASVAFMTFAHRIAQILTLAGDGAPQGISSFQNLL